MQIIFSTGKQCPFVQKGLRLLVGIPNPPRTVLRTGCTPEESGTFYGRRFTANKKEGRQQPHDCHLPNAHRCPLSCFLLLPPLLFINLQKSINVLLCDLIVHHFLLCRAVFLIQFSLFCKDAAVLGWQILHAREFLKPPLVKCFLRRLMQKNLIPMTFHKSFAVSCLPILGVTISCLYIVTAQ